jgi:hypothetical protein
MFLLRSISRALEAGARLAAAAMRLALLVATLFGLSAAATAQTPSPYRFATPPGWAAAMEGDIATVTPQSEPPGSVQLMLLAPRPASADFSSQFEAERRALESFWALRAPHSAPPQAGRAVIDGKAIDYAAHFASYDSDAGERYLGFMALGDGQRFALAVFVAASAEGFNRLAPQAVEVLRGLSFAH